MVSGTETFTEESCKARGEASADRTRSWNPEAESTPCLSRSSDGSSTIFCSHIRKRAALKLQHAVEHIRRKERRQRDRALDLTRRDVSDARTVSYIIQYIGWLSVVCTHELNWLTRSPKCPCAVSERGHGISERRITSGPKNRSASEYRVALRRVVRVEAEKRNAR